MGYVKCGGCVCNVGWVGFTANRATGEFSII